MVSLILSVLIMWVIGWQASMRAFPFCSWRVRKPESPIDIINCVFTIWNLWMFLMTWIGLGLFTIPAIGYVLVMGLAFYVGWAWIDVLALLSTARTMGWRYALLDYWDRLKRKFHSTKR